MPNIFIFILIPIFFVACGQKESDSCQGEINRLKKELADKQFAYISVGKIVEEVDAQLSDIATKKKEIDELLKSKDAVGNKKNILEKISKIKDHIANSQKTLDRLESQLASTQNENQNLQLLVKQLRADLQEKNALIGNLESKVKNLESTVAQLRQDLSEQDAIIKRNEAELKRRDEEIVKKTDENTQQTRKSVIDDAKYLVSNATLTPGETDNANFASTKSQNVNAIKVSFNSKMDSKTEIENLVFEVFKSNGTKMATNQKILPREGNRLQVLLEFNGKLERNYKGKLKVKCYLNDRANNITRELIYAGETIDLK
jgi:chromosome segregation ATPase